MNRLSKCPIAATGKGPGGYGYEVTHTCDLGDNHDMPHHDPRVGDWDACPEQWCRLLNNHQLPHRNLSYEPITPGFAHHVTPEQIAAATLPTDDVPPELEGLRGPFTGLVGPWGIPRETPEELQARRDECAAEQERENRDRAVQHAINAIEPHHDLEPYRVAELADAIVSLATRLGGYIKNGS